MSEPKVPVGELSGRDLDAAVGEALGLDKRRVCFVMNHQTDEDIFCYACGHLVKKAPMVHDRYSTDIAAALRVVDAVQWGELDDFVLLQNGQHWVAGEAGYDMVNINGPYATGETAPEAICRAALKAVRETDQ